MSVVRAPRGRVIAREVVMADRVPTATASITTSASRLSLRRRVSAESFWRSAIRRWPSARRDSSARSTLSRALAFFASTAVASAGRPIA